MTSIVVNPYEYVVPIPTAVASSFQATLDVGMANTISGNSFSSVTGGRPPYSYSIVSGSIPVGMSLIPTSGYAFNGSSYLSSPANTQYAMAGDFTAECWALANTTITTAAGLFNINSGGSSGLAVFFDTNQRVSFFVRGNGTVTSTNNNTVLPNNWYHIALVRSSGTNTLYVNGVSAVSSSTASNIPSANAGIGREYNDNTGYTFLGYISNVRIVKGQALYTGNFSPTSLPKTLATNSVGTTGVNVASGITGTVILLSAQSSNTTTLADNSYINAPFVSTGSVTSFNGVVFGTPTASQSNTSYTVQVSDGSGTPASQQSTSNYYVVNPTITASACSASQSYTTGSAITSYNPLTASNGTTPYIYTYTGTIPAGLNYDSGTGILSGTPTIGSGGSYNAVFSVTDILGIKASTTSTVAFTIYDLPPLAPTIGDVNIDLVAATDGSGANVAYTAPDQSNRAAITSYTAMAFVSGSDTGLRNSVSRTGSGSVPITGLSPKTTYTFKVYATNSGGAGANSTNSSTYIIATPSAPTNISVVNDTSSDGTQANVAYTAPTNSYKAPITSYTANAFVGGVDSGISGSVSRAGSGSIPVSGLTRGTTYTFKVYASNFGGDGASSSASSNYTVPSVDPRKPLAPSSITSSGWKFTSTTTGSMTITLGAASVNSGSPAITSYTVKSTDGSITVGPQAGLTFTIPLSDSTQRTFYGYATNSAGDGATISLANPIGLAGSVTISPYGNGTETTITGTWNVPSGQGITRLAVVCVGAGGFGGSGSGGGGGGGGGLAWANNITSGVSDNAAFNYQVGGMASPGASSLRDTWFNSSGYLNGGGGSTGGSGTGAFYSAGGGGAGGYSGGGGSGGSGGNGGSVLSSGGSGGGSTGTARNSGGNGGSGGQGRSGTGTVSGTAGSGGAGGGGAGGSSRGGGGGVGLFGNAAGSSGAGGTAGAPYGGVGSGGSTNIGGGGIGSGNSPVSGAMCIYYGNSYSIYPF